MKSLFIIAFIFLISCNDNSFRMGFFDKIFNGNKVTGENKPEKYEENWDFYFTNVDDKFSSIALDLGLQAIAPIKDKPYIIWVSIKLNNPNKDGLPSKLEMDYLEKIEEELDERISNKHNAIFAGRLSSDGLRDFYFYASDTTDYEVTTSEIMKQFPDYKYNAGTKEDKEWSDYLDFLYPLPEQIQNMENRKVVQSLKDNGDNLTKPREVNHWIYFKSEKDRARFIKKVENDRFKVENQEYDKSLGEFPYKLRISRMDNVDLNSVDEYTIYLWKLAQDFNGDYDGWETQVLK